MLRIKRRDDSGDRTALRAAVGLVLMAACSKSNVQPASEPHVAQPSPAERETPSASSAKHDCSSDLYAGFETPQAAYAEYLNNVRSREWCRAANTFDQSARHDLALANFKALAALAGADNPKREFYLQSFRPLCAKYALSCDSEERIYSLAADIVLGQPIEALEPAVDRVALISPEDLYVDVMTSLADVDPGSIMDLQPAIESLEYRDENFATAKNKRPGTEQWSKLAFRKKATGWFMSVR